jgi:hypothetical protein
VSFWITTAKSMHASDAQVPCDCETKCDESVPKRADVVIAKEGQYGVHLSKGRSMCGCQATTRGWKAKAKVWCVHKLFVVQALRLDVTPLECFATPQKTIDTIKGSIDAMKHAKGDIYPLG